MAAADDLSEFVALSNPKRRDCAIAEALAQLPAPDRDRLQAACEASAGVITSKAISAWLEARGIAVKWQRIYPHRQGSCSCNE